MPRRVVLWLLFSLSACAGPWLWADFGAARLSEQDARAILPLARTVAARAVSGNVVAQTGSPLFDGEWTLVTCQMTAIGLSAVIERFPQSRAELLPGLRACAERLVDPSLRAFATARWSGEDGFSDEALGGTHGHAYLGWLASGLGAARQILVDPPWAQQHDHLVAGLAKRLEWAPPRIETYPGQVFPADIASVVAAVALHATATGRDEPRLADFVQRYRTAFEDSETGWVGHRVDRGIVASPRGSTTSVVAWFLGFADTAAAARLYSALVTRGADSPLGFSGFREYPRGRSGPMDIDSGPIVLGLGVSASGFALGPAMRHGDTDRVRAGLRAARLLGVHTRRGDRATFLAGGPIGDALLLAMLTTKRL